MAIKISQRIQAISPSPLYDIFRKAQEKKAGGWDIDSLGVGEHFEGATEYVRRRGIEAIEQGKTGYLPSAGSMALRESLAKRYGASASEIFVSSGAKAVLGVVMACLVDKDDFVFIPTPYYPPFLEITHSLGGIHIFIHTEPNSFRLTAKMVEEAIETYGRKPKVLLVNTPNNPAGVVYDKEELSKIAKLAEKHDFFVVADECYSNFSADKDFSMRQFSEHVIAINSMSKSYGMTGWRLGWAVAPSSLVPYLQRYADNFIGCPSAIADYASQEAFGHESLDDLKKQRGMMLDWLKKMGLKYDADEGGIYVFVDFSRYFESGKISGSIKLAEYLLDEGKVVTIPGVAFGDAFDGYLRISYSVAPATLTRALGRIEEALGKI